MNSRRRREAGSALGEQLIVWAVMVLYGVMLLVAFSQSLAAGFGMIAFTITVGVLIMVYGLRRDRRRERARVDARLADLEQAALAHGAVIDALFIGRGENGVVAAFGVAGPAGKVFFARETWQKERTGVVGFGEVTAAFARPDGPQRYRLEVRGRAEGAPSPPAAFFLAVEDRDEANRWVETLKPHLGERAKFIDIGPDDGSREAARP